MEVYDELERALKEIERLNKDLQTAIDICNNRQKEIVRLNNIINELEKVLKECMQHYDYLYDKFEEKEALDTYYDYKYVFDKLKELKGDSSNE